MTGETRMSLADCRLHVVWQSVPENGSCERKRATAGCWQTVRRDVQLQRERRQQTATTWQDLTSSCQSICFLRSPLVVNFFRQILHVNQVPSLLWLQQMCLKLEKPRKTTRTVSTWEWLCISMNTNILLQFSDSLWTVSHRKDTHNGLLLPWTKRLCCCKWPDIVKLLSHSEQTYGLSPVWNLIWLSRCSDSLNALSHTKQLYGLSSMCTLIWRSRFPDWLNALSHTWHLYPFSPLWVLLCTTRLPDVENRLPQRVHSNSFSPEWLRLCTARCWRVVQHLPHTEHLYLLVWIYIWRWRLYGHEKTFSHWLQVCVTPECRFWCSLKYPWVTNCSSDTVHKYGVGL